MDEDCGWYRRYNVVLIGMQPAKPISHNDFVVRNSRLWVGLGVELVVVVVYRGGSQQCRRNDIWEDIQGIFQTELVE